MGRSEGVGYLCLSFLNWEVKWIIVASVQPDSFALRFSCESLGKSSGSGLEIATVLVPYAPKI